MHLGRMENHTTRVMESQNRLSTSSLSHGKEYCEQSDHRLMVNNFSGVLEGGEREAFYNLFETMNIIDFICNGGVERINSKT